MSGQIISLKRRIKSVNNTKKITRAMELVAASKMKKAQDEASASREYAEAAKSMLKSISRVSDVSHHPLFAKRAPKNKLTVVITSNRGLAGAYNGNIFRLLTTRIRHDHHKGIKTEVVAIGRQATHFLPRIKEVKLGAAYPMFGDQPTETEVKNIVLPIFKRFQESEIDVVEVLYTHFVSNLSQEATSIVLLPTEITESEKISPLEVAIFEPKIEETVEQIVLRLFTVQLWQALLDSLASEHSMRMMAMKSATDNANEIVDDLTLEYNSARQAAITQEIAEIVGGSAAIGARA